MFEGSQPRPVSLMRLIWKNWLREEWVLPAPPKPGVVQLVPVEVPKSKLPEPSAASEIEPQLSLIRTYWPASVEVAAPTEV